MEVNRADYRTLLRVPGIGLQVGKPDREGRKLGTLGFPDLKKMGVVLKRAVYFITCSGRMQGPVRMNEDSIARSLLSTGEKLPEEVTGQGYRQLFPCLTM